MSSDREEKSVALNFLAGMGLGALVGAAAALLLAPKSGEETRKDIACVADDLKCKASKVVDDLTESSEELVKKSKELLEATKSRVQTAVEAGRQAMSRKREGEESEGSEA